MLDAGNALVRKKGWAHTDNPDAKELARRKARAELILRFYKKVGSAALGVGPEDLLLGLDTIRKLAKAQGVPMISVNLADKRGKRVFPGSVLVDTKFGKVGIVSALWLPSNKAHYQPPKDVKILEPKDLVSKEVQSLRSKGAKFVILAAAMDMTRARTLLTSIPGIDLAVVTGRGAWLLRPQKAGKTYIVAVPPGGKHIGFAELHLVDGSFEFEDFSSIVSTKTRIDRMLSTWRRYESLAERVSGPQKKRYERRVDNLKRAVQRMMKSLEKALARKAKGSFLLAQVVGLDAAIGDDPSIQDMVDKVKKSHDIDDLKRRHPKKSPFAKRIPAASFKRLRGIPRRIGPGSPHRIRPGKRKAIKSKK